MPLTTKFGLEPLIAPGDVLPSPQSIVAAKSPAESLESALNVATVPPTGEPGWPENELPPAAEIGSTVMPGVREVRQHREGLRHSWGQVRRCPS